MIEQYVGNGVMAFHGVVEKQEHDEAEWIESIERLNQPPYHPEATGVGFYFRANDSQGETPSRYFIPPTSQKTYWDAKIYECLQHYCCSYPEVIPTVHWTFDGHLLTYENSQHIGWHSDNLIARYPPDKYGHMPESQFSIHLTLSALLYLNDDYLGGEIEWKYANASLKPRAGSVVIYPSHFMGTHRVLPCIGKRKAYVKFYGHGYPTSHTPQSLVWLSSLQKDSLCVS